MTAVRRLSARSLPGAIWRSSITTRAGSSTARYAIRRIVVDGVELPVTREGQGVRIGREVITDLNTGMTQRLDVELG